MIRDLVKKFNPHGTVENLLHERQRTALMLNVLANVQKKLTMNPGPSSKSLHRIVKENGLLYGTTHRTLVTHNLHSSHIRVVHELLPLNFEKCEQNCRWFSNLFENHLFLLYNTFYSDKAWFSLFGYINSQNNSVWSDTNPHILHEAPIHLQKLGVWGTILGHRVIGLIFFMQTITSDIYLDIIEQFIDLLPIRMWYYWFQQDDTKAHTTYATMLSSECFLMIFLSLSVCSQLDYTIWLFAILQATDSRQLVTQHYMWNWSSAARGAKVCGRSE